MKLRVVEDVARVLRTGDELTVREILSTVSEAIADSALQRGKVFLFGAATHGPVEGEDLRFHYSVPLSSAEITGWVAEAADYVVSRMDAVLHDIFSRSEPRTAVVIRPRLDNPTRAWAAAVMQCRSAGSFNPESLMCPARAWQASIAPLVRGIDGISMRPDLADDRVRSVLRHQYHLTVDTPERMDPWNAAQALLVGPKSSVAQYNAPFVSVRQTDTRSLDVDVTVRVRFFPNIPFATVTIQE